MKKTLTAAAVAAIIAPIGATYAETNVTVGGYARTGFNFFMPDEGDDSTNFTYRGRFQVDARNDAGVRGTLRLQGDGNTSDGNVAIDRALIQYNGFRIGYSDSFQTTHHGYGNPVERQDGDYGFDQAHFIDYTGSISGFSYGIGVQDTDQRNEGNTDLDFYIGTGFELAGANVKVSYLQDTNAGEGQYKISAGYALGGFSLNAGFRGQTGANVYGATPTDPADEEDGIASYWAGAKFGLNDAMSVGLGFSANDNEDSEAFTATLFWSIAPDLSFRPEIHVADPGTNVGFRLYRTF
jgi:hypothetical protein